MSFTTTYVVLCGEVMMSVTIEVAGIATDELLAGLNKLLPQLSTTAPALKLADLERVIRSPSITLFVASDNDEVIGSLTLAMFPIPTGVRAWIEDVVVDGSSRGAGVGEALIGAAINEARRSNARSIDLTSRPDRESANGLYKKIGFEQRHTNVYRFLVQPPGDDSQ
jgi:ribosomal protein S18 acetylase RimI-like enzyme